MRQSSFKMMSVACGLILWSAQATDVIAQECSFPWCAAPAANTQSPYQTLPRPPKHQHHEPQVPIQPMPPKSSYAYGWFGSNPTPHWDRHFGTSRSYTQWTRR